MVLSMPLAAHQDIPAARLQGNTVLVTSDYYPSKDGRIAGLDNHTVTTSELVQRHFAGVNRAKAFSNIIAHHISQLALTAEATDRAILPLASDSLLAATQTSGLINRLGFDAVTTGTLSQSWRFEPDAAVYTRVYLADPSTPDQQLMEAAGVPVTDQTARRASTGSATGTFRQR